MWYFQLIISHKTDSLGIKTNWNIILFSILNNS